MGQLASFGLLRTEPWRDQRRLKAETQLHRVPKLLCVVWDLFTRLLVVGWGGVV